MDNRWYPWALEGPRDLPSRNMTRTPDCRVDACDSSVTDANALGVEHNSQVQQIRSKRVVAAKVTAQSLVPLTRLSSLWRIRHLDVTKMTIPPCWMKTYIPHNRHNRLARKSAVIPDEAVAPPGYDVRLVGPHHRAVPGDADGGGDATWLGMRHSNESTHLGPLGDASGGVVGSAAATSARRACPRRPRCAYCGFPNPTFMSLMTSRWHTTWDDDTKFGNRQEWRL